MICLTHKRVCRCCLASRPAHISSLTKRLNNSWRNHRHGPVRTDTDNPQLSGLTIGWFDATRFAYSFTIF
jgi:hypothetical protein